MALFCTAVKVKKNETLEMVVTINKVPIKAGMDSRRLVDAVLRRLAAGDLEIQPLGCWSKPSPSFSQDDDGREPEYTLLGVEGGDPLVLCRTPME